MARYLMIACLLASWLQAADKPNIVLILADDMAWMGTSVRMKADNPASRERFRPTPNIARLAQQGMTFSNAYAAAGMCAPARASLQTGMTTARTRFSGNGGFGDKCPTEVTYDTRGKNRHRTLIEPVPMGSLQPSCLTIAEQLAPHGYKSAHFGKWHAYGGGPGKRGYVAHDGETSNEEGNSDDPKDPKRIFSMTRSGMAFMTEQVTAKQPFFLQLSHYAEHNAVQARPQTLKALESDKTLAKIKDKSLRRRVLARTAMVEDMDSSIGMVLDKINELGIADNTYVIFTADNGHHRENGDKKILRGDKWWLYECGIRVPMIVRGPSIAAGSRCATNVIAYDFLPTFVDLAGGDPAQLNGVDGLSLAPLFSGNAAIGKLATRALFFHYPHHRNTAMQSAIIKGDDKLFVFYECPGELYLYNLENDLAERHNLASTMPEKASLLEKELMTYLASVDACMPKPNPDAAADYVTYDPAVYDAPLKKGKK